MGGQLRKQLRILSYSLSLGKLIIGQAKLHEFLKIYNSEILQSIEK